MALAQQKFITAADWLIKALLLFVEVKDYHYTAMAIRNYAQLINEDITISSKLEYRWRISGLNEVFPFKKLQNTALQINQENGEQK